MGFAVAAEAYDRFMGRYSVPLATAFADFAAAAGGGRVLDVGCGTGALTAELVARWGAQQVSAVDPSPSFVAAMRDRHPGVDVRDAAAEALPFSTGTFDGALAQLVVHFMADPRAGLREMGRVTRPGGTVAACVWDYRGGEGPASSFWDAARELDPDVDDESDLTGAGEGDLLRLLSEVGFADVEETALSIAVTHPTFDEWWQPFTLGVGPPGVYVATLDVDRRRALEARCRAHFSHEPFTIVATAWAARGRVAAR